MRRLMLAAALLAAGCGADPARGRLEPGTRVIVVTDTGGRAGVEAEGHLGVDHGATGVVVEDDGDAARALRPVTVRFEEAPPFTGKIPRSKLRPVR